MFQRAHSCILHIKATSSLTMLTSGREFIECVPPEIFQIGLVEKDFGVFLLLRQSPHALAWTGCCICNVVVTLGLNSRSIHDDLVIFFNLTNYFHSSNKCPANNSGFTVIIYSAYVACCPLMIKGIPKSNNFSNFSVYILVLLMAFLRALKASYIFIVR